MNILITGANGFIGSWLAEYALRDGHKLVLMDKFTNVSFDNPWLTKNKKNIVIIRSDIAKINKINIKELNDINCIFHVCGKGNIKASYENPVDYHVSNVQTTLIALEIARKYNIKSFIYPMTSAGFYDPKKVPIDENELVIPKSPYTLTKKMGEELAMHWYKVYGIKTVSLRLFHVYGPTSPLGKSAFSRVSAAVNARLAGKPFLIDSDGLYTQDFVHIKDVYNAFIKSYTSGIGGEKINIGTGIGTNMLKLAEIIGVKTKSNNNPYLSPHDGVADITKAKKIIGYKPEIKLEVGIKNLLN